MLSKRWLSLTALMLGAVLFLAACNSTEKNVKRCEQHFNAKSYKVAFDYCQKAAKDGDPSGQYHLAMMFYRGLGVDGDVEQARQWMFRAAEQDYEKAVFHRALYYLTTKDPEVSLAQKKQALTLLQNYAEAGDAIAQYWMGNVFYFGYIKGHKSYNEAIYWYQLAIEQDNYQAMNNLAWLKVVSPGTELFDPQEGLRLAKKVVEKYPESHGYLDTLAAAYAANGEFDKAIVTQLKVIELASQKPCKDCKKDMLDYYQQHLEAYRQRKPLIKAFD